jgi:hypothetical protein
MEYLDVKCDDSTNPNTVIAATFCMMSCTIESGCTLYLPRIADNLDWLSDRQCFDTHFRRLFARLAAHWEAKLSAQNAAA